jgi:hypothetical protein
MNVVVINIDLIEKKVRNSMSVRSNFITMKTIDRTVKARPTNEISPLGLNLFFVSFVGGN